LKEADWTIAAEARDFLKPMYTVTVIMQWEVVVKFARKNVSTRTE